MKKISDFNSATEKYPVVYAGSASRPEYVDMPTILQQQEGVAPMDTLPAQWWNAMWKLATRDINAFRDYVGDAFTEINNLLTKFNITLDDADSEQLYDFFHDDYVQNYLSTIFVNKSGDTIDGDLHVKGDLSVDGVGEEIISTELKVGANTITLRNENPTGLGNTELAGVVTENYDGNSNNNIIAIDKNGVARTGDIDVTTRILYSNDGVNFYLDEALTNAATIGADEEVRDTGNQTSGGVEIYEGVTYSNDNTQALATRENTPLNGGYAVWNGALKRFDTVPQGQNKSSFTIFVPGGDEVALAGPLTKNVTVAGITALADGMSVQVMFTSAIQSTNSITQLNLNINSLGDVPIKVPSNNTLQYLASHVISSGGGYDPTYPNRLCDAWITLDLVYSVSETSWIVVGNPVIMSCPDYTIYANGKVEKLEQATYQGNYGSSITCKKCGKLIQITVSSINNSSTNQDMTILASNVMDEKFRPNEYYIIRGSADVSAWGGDKGVGFVFSQDGKINTYSYVPFIYGFVTFTFIKP